jgi:uncharacterized protein involved in type VI secretion and phage assembly
MSIVDVLNSSQDHTQQRNKIYGVVVGIVRDIKDPETLGRIKVDFPWLGDQTEAVVITSAEDKAHSYWARIATLMAGNDRGTYFIPEVGDEVLVAFEHGDPDRPFVIGALWNADDPPREKMDNEGKNNIRSITSRSGHRIVLDDSDEEPAIHIVDKTGENRILINSASNAMEIKVTGDLTIDVGGNLSITAKGTAKIAADQDITSKTNANLEFKATGNGTFESSGPVNIKSGAKLTVDSTGQAEVKAATVSINGSAMTEVKGALVKIN